MRRSLTAVIRTIVDRGLRVALVAVAVAGCDRPEGERPAPVLLFTGGGTSAGDVAAVEHILDANKLAYHEVSSAQLNAMMSSQLQSYRLILVPGGDFIRMSQSLTAETTGRVREAVQRGVGYLGICAGAFLAGDGGRYYNSFNLTSGTRFGFYSAEKRGIRKAPVLLAAADGPPMEHYWEDGPELSGWGDVVAKYPDGTPAVVEGAAGKGWVILAGVHPEAPEGWRRGMQFTMPASAASAYAGTLLLAALNRSSLPHY